MKDDFTNGEDGLSELRAKLRSPHMSPFRRLLSTLTLEILDRLIDDYEIRGYTDPAAMSFLATWVAVNQPKRVLQLGTWIGFSTGLLVNPAKNTSTQKWMNVHEG
jgi:predicted O-methyltransferase YrrM